MKNGFRVASMRWRMTLYLAGFIGFLLSLAGVAGYVQNARVQERAVARTLDRVEEIALRGFDRGAGLEDLALFLDNFNARSWGSGREPIAAWLLDATGQPIWHNAPKERSRKGQRLPEEGTSELRERGFGRDLRGLPPMDYFSPRHDSQGARGREWPSGNETPVPVPLALNGVIPPRAQPALWRAREIRWGRRTLIVAASWTRNTRDLRREAMAILGVTLLATLLSGVGGYFLVGKTLRPIDELARQARTLAAHPSRLLGAQSQPLRATSSDLEMTRLVETLSQMLDRVREAALSRERFHTAASHELRTPLQALGGHLSLALSRPRSPEEYRQTLEEAARQTERLSELTQDLLLLNRINTASAVPPRDLVDLSEIADLALTRAEKLIAARNLQLQELLTSVEVLASASHLEILLGNLVENAAKYAKSGGVIRLKVEKNGPGVVVWNECDLEVAAQLNENLPRLLEPFFRPDAARNSKIGGNGLGLALCDAVCEANGWKLNIETTTSPTGVSAQVSFVG